MIRSQFCLLLVCPPTNVEAQAQAGVENQGTVQKVAGVHGSAVGQAGHCKYGVHMSWFVLHPHILVLGSEKWLRHK